MGFMNFVGNALGAIGSGIHGAYDYVKGGLDGRQPVSPEQAGFTPGMPGYQEYLKQMDQYLRGGNPYGQAAQVGGGTYDQNYANYVKGLEDMAAGRGPSLAEKQYKAASAQQMQNVAAQGASGRGNPNIAARHVAEGQAQIGQGLAAGVAQARTNEQMQAQQQLGGALAGASQNEYQRQALNAQLQQQSNLANQQAWLQMLQQKMGLSSEQAQNLLGYYQALAAQQGAFANSPTGFDRFMNVIGTIGGLGGLGGK